MENTKNIQLMQENEEHQSIYELELDEYFLHIYLQETTSLRLKDEADLLIRIKAFGQEKLTKVIKQQGPGSQTFWGNHFFFNKKFDNRQELENSSYEIQVLDHNALLKNDIIGEFSGSITDIYQEKNHFKVNQWGILSNSENIGVNHSGFMGFLKYSISFIRAKEIRVNLEDEANRDSSEMKLISIPANIQMKKKQIIIRVYRGDKIVSHDGNGQADPYVKFSLGGLQIQTKTCEETLTPYFYQKLLFPTLFPAIISRLKMCVMDKDKQIFNSDDCIGSTYFNLQDIEKGKFKHIQWINIYGSHYKVQNEKIAKKMNEFPEIGSTYKGQILMNIEIKDTEEPAFVVQDLNQEESIQEQSLIPIKIKARLDFDYVQHISLQKGNKYKICVNWGNTQYYTKQKNYQMKVLIIAEQIFIEQEFFVRKENWINVYDQLPDLIISVCDVQEKTHYSFYRFVCKNILQTRKNYKEPFIVNMKADNAISELNQYEAGILRLSCAIIESQNSEILNLNSWPFETQINCEKISIICYMFQGKDLIPGDSKGTSDCTLQFYHLGSYLTSMTFPSSLNPSWNQQIMLESFMYNNSLPQMIVNVFDRDNEDLEFIGQAVVDLTQDMIAKTKDDLLICKNPKWYDVTFDKEEKAGSLLLGFSIVRTQQNKEISLFLDQMNLKNTSKNIPLIKQKHHIKVSVLGLRNLQSTGVLPVKRTKLKINTSSLQNMHNLSEGAAFTDLEANSKNAGPNPTFGTVLNMMVDLPQSISHMPSLSCEVLDQGMGFFGNSLIGVFQINTGAFAYVSNISLYHKLNALMEKTTKIVDSNPQNQKQVDNLIIMKQLLFELKEQIDQSQSVVEQTSISLFKTGQAKMKSKYNLSISEDEIKGSKQNTTIDDEQPKQGTNPLALNMKVQLANKRKENLLEEVADVKVVQRQYISNKEIAKALLKRQNKEFPILDILKNEILNTQGVDKFDSNFQQKLQQKISLQLQKQEPIIIQPQYESQIVSGRTIQFENQFPDPTKYVALGYKSKIKNTKHYRKQINTELENSIYMGDEIFTKINMFKGKKLSLQKESFINRLIGTKVENYRETGYFRGNVQIIQDSILQQLMKLKISDEDKKILEIPLSLDDWKQNELESEILRSVKVLVRVYIIDAEFYQSMDYNSENDSYIVISIGDKKIEDNEVHVDQNNPKYFKCYSFEHEFPGPSNLKITFYDQDTIRPDDMIGSTDIDIERRYFDQTWRNQKALPIEKRNLYLPSLSRSQGWMRCWVDIQQKDSLQPEVEIQPRPKTNLELRVIIWEIWDVPHLDFEEVSDLYVKVSLPAFELSMSTDTHYRAQNGFGCFNWRTKFKLTIDEYSKHEMLRLNLRIYDKDFLSQDDFYSDTTLDISQLVSNVLQNEIRESYLGKSYEKKENQKKFILETIAKEDFNKSKKPAKILLSIDCLTEQEAENSPAGIGRSDPNQDPFLPAPTGRFIWSLNPLKLLNQLVGPNFRNKMCLLIFMIFFTVFVVFLIPGLVTSLISNMII